MQERRKYPRTHLIHYLMVFDQDSRKALGNLVDVTPEGIMMITPTPLVPDRLYTLRMNLPDDFEHQGPLLFTARCIWRRVDINPDLYASGLKLEKISPDDQQIITRLIEEYRD